VIAASDGVISSTRPNRLGGTVVRLLGAGRRVYYYAHLDRLAPETRVGRFVRAGDVLGEVGTTGNARGGPPHLHVGIYTLRGGAIAPHPLLAAGPVRRRPAHAQTALRRVRRNAVPCRERVSGR
jgi:murein DD-endopeptidase MepM/ murein hydrolase activator NlpD